MEQTDTSGGNETKLFAALLVILKVYHVSGRMLGVSDSNKRAVSFYQKMGFSVINRSEYGYTMGMKL